jgi:hypothetical protein
VIGPGFVNPGMSRARGQELIWKVMLWRHVGQPGNIAALALYVAADKSGFVTVLHSQAL